jgi:hypothetical protein
MLAMFCIGGKGDLTEETARRSARRTVKTIERRISPRMAVTLSVAGFDSDPREIWEIPEARSYVLAFADEMVKCGVNLGRVLLPQSCMMIQACLAAEFGRRVEVIGTVDDAVRTAVEQAKRNFEQRGRELH